jgi:hypothetical protein
MEGYNFLIDSLSYLLSLDFAPHNSLISMMFEAHHAAGFDHLRYGFMHEILHKLLTESDSFKVFIALTTEMCNVSPGSSHCPQPVIL